MAEKNKKLIQAMSQKPTPKNISWKKIEKLLVSTGATIREGKGSGVTFYLNNKVFSAHRPHPQKEAKPYQVRAALMFLKRAGIIK